MFDAYNDSELQRISPQLLRDYLRGAGWVFHEPYGAYASIFAAPSGVKALVPSLQESEFYPTRVRELLSAIVAADNLSEPALFNDLRYHGRDVTRLIAPTDPGRDTLPPREFNRLASGARQVWEDAVRAVGMDSAQEEEYWAAAGFGHTEPGSFVFTMCSPIVTTLDGQLGLMPEGQAQSSARKVTSQLRESVQATRAALTELKGGNDDAFDKASERGITLATCQGIGKTVESSNEVRWVIGESGGPGFPTMQHSTVMFENSEATLLDQAAEVIRREGWVSEPAVAELFGYINNFRKPQHDEEAKATMKTLIQGAQGEQTVHVVLGPHQYETAWRLHKSDQNAAAKGMLVRTGAKTWEMRDTRIGLATMQDDPDAY